MKVDRLLFLAASASMAAGVAACVDRRVADSLFGGPAAAHDQPTSVSDDPDAALSIDGSDASPDAPDSESDGGTVDAADAEVEAGPVLPDGDPNVVCAPFTCELAELSCLAAMKGGLNAKVAAELYACAQTDCVPDKNFSELRTIGLNCATAALAVDSATPPVNPLCSDLVDCVLQPGDLSAARCEVLYSALTSTGMDAVNDRALTCGAYTEEDFVWSMLYDLAYP